MSFNESVNDLKEKLEDEILDCNVEVYDCISSTMPIIDEKLLKFNSAIAIAFVQKVGRGRNERAFVSNFGGLYASFGFCLDKPFVFATKSVLYAGLSVAKALKTQGVNVKLKWPNDIILNNKKLGGIISKCSLTKSNVEKVNYGIGINLDNELPNDLINIATSTKLQGYCINFEQLIVDIYKNLRYSINNEDVSLLHEYRKYSCTIGNEVFIDVKKERFGIAVDIDENGYLLVEIDGEIRQVSYGDVTIKKEIYR